MNREMLVNAAKNAMCSAYAPYSGYMVGAALLCEDGSVYTGCNVENAAYSVTNCAERTALFKAVSEGKRQFKAMAVCGGKHGLIADECTPCGVCRQVMREFCDDSFIVYTVSNTQVRAYSLGELLPHSFGAAQISENP